jgi:hypothetical protein
MLAGWPGADLGCFGVLWDATFVGALVAEDDEVWCCEEEFGSRDSGTCATKTMEDSVDVV